jgi:hypothetical protein
VNDYLQAFGVLLIVLAIMAVPVAAALYARRRGASRLTTRRLQVTVALYILFGTPVSNRVDGWAAVVYLAITLVACWVVASALVHNTRPEVESRGATRSVE